MTGSAPSSTGRIERDPVTPAAVIDAALTAFAKLGYHGTSLREVAALLHIRTPSLYNHMTSKQGLLEEIVGETTRAVWDDYVAAVRDQPDVETRLRNAIYVYAYRHATRRREALVVNRDISSLEDPARSEILGMRRQHEHAVRGLIQEGIEARVFANQPASLVSFAVLEMCVSIARWFRDGGQFTPEEVAQNYSDYAVSIAKGGHASDALRR